MIRFYYKNSSYEERKNVLQYCFCFGDYYPLQADDSIWDFSIMDACWLRDDVAYTGILPETLFLPIEAHKLIESDGYRWKLMEGIVPLYDKKNPDRVPYFYFMCKANLNKPLVLPEIPQFGWF